MKIAKINLLDDSLTRTDSYVIIRARITGYENHNIL